MRYRLETRYRKYVQGHAFLSFARNFGNKYGEKLMNIAGKKIINTTKKQGTKFVKTKVLK